ncbi:uracil phosphoribosyltransferase-like [Humulus lupulus]|uniref:uracil phosphoribosyltransferase-like n=1 Tax=Humulus lupulus TaxID=3486 RepID=UPI002B411C78|nr:uracil phosphoribosyltransferase-like [Humulus lupulus]
MDVAMIEFIDPREPVAVIPILRAGLALAEHASSILPATKTYHLGGTIVAALNLIKKCGVENSQIKVVTYLQLILHYFCQFYFIVNGVGNEFVYELSESILILNFRCFTYKVVVKLMKGGTN